MLRALVRGVVEVGVVDDSPELDVPAEVDAAPLEDEEARIGGKVAALGSTGGGGCAAGVAAATGVLDVHDVPVRVGRAALVPGAIGLGDLLEGQ